MSDLGELYQEVIIDHNKNPRNFRVMEDANRVVEAYNPLCGDRYTIYLKLDGDTISDIAFTGSGCAISKSSASVMSTVLKGLRTADADGWFEKFHTLVTKGASGEGAIAIEEFGKLAAFSGISEFPARVKCAILSWHTMKNALHSDVSTVSTE